MRRSALALLLLALPGCVQPDDRPLQLAGPWEAAMAGRRQAAPRAIARMGGRGCEWPALDNPMIGARLLDAGMPDAGFIMPEVVLFDCARSRQVSLR